MKPLKSLYFPLLGIFLFISLSSFVMAEVLSVPSNRVSAPEKNKSFILPEGWSLEKNPSLTKRASTLEYQYSDKQRAPFVPSQLYSTYLGGNDTPQKARANKSAPAISSYVEGCTVDGRVTDVLFNERNSGLIIGGFYCLGRESKARRLVVYLADESGDVNQHLVFVWNEKSGSVFSAQDEKIRIGYALQSGMQYLVCGENQVECQAADREKYMLDQVREAYRIPLKSIPKSNINESLKNNVGFWAQYYNFHLTLFGFVPYMPKEVQSRCHSIFKLKDPSLTVCPASIGEFTSSINDHNALTNSSANSFLRKIVARKPGAKADGVSCDVGTPSPFIFASNKSFGVARKIEWKACKEEGVVRGLVAVIKVSQADNESAIMQYYWDVPESATKTLEEFGQFIVDEQLKESLNIFRCDESLYLQACNFKS